MAPGLNGPKIRIGGRSISSENSCFIVAEAGTGHRGEVSLAKELVDASSSAGADCVKFQSVFADEIVHPKSGEIELPGGKTKLFDIFRTLERDEIFYSEIKSYAEQRDLIFLCTPFGLRSAEMLNRIGVLAFKIASPELNHLPLLDYCSSVARPCIVSTGVSTLGDIETAIDHLRSPIALLHCVTSYPAPPEEYNLLLIENLSAIFGVTVGVSDHSIDPILVPVLARLSGASIIEKHITLEESSGGLDDPIAQTPAGLNKMIEAIRNSETDPTGALEVLTDRWGEEMIELCLGDGVKRMAPTELGSYQTTNRSILAIRDIPEGERFTCENTALLRSETNIEPGLNPSFHPLVLNRVAKCRVNSGRGIRWRDVGDQAPSATSNESPVASTAPAASRETKS